MERKTLIILTPGFPADETDTTCLPSQQLFIKTTHELFPTLKIEVVAIHYPYHSSSYKWHGVDIHPLNGNSQRGMFRFLTWIRCYRALSKITSTSDLLGILSFWCNETALLGNFFAKRNRLNHKIWISGQDARKTNSFVKWINPKPNDLVAMSDFLKNEFQKNHGISVSHVIPNAVNDTFMNLKKDIDVIGVGSLIPLKQFRVVVEIIAELKKDFPNVTAKLFGKGPEESMLRQLIKDRELEKNLELMGEVDHNTLMTWMNRAKVLIHPSSYEGYSTVCIEALANGCHVVSFTHSERETVKHWSVVSSEFEMKQVVSKILTSEVDFTPLLMRDMKTTARQMTSLFGLHS